MMLSTFVVLFLFMAQQPTQPEPSPAWGLPLHGEEAEHFLRTAEIVSIKSFKTKAVTRPKKVELTNGEQTHYALFKTIDEFEPMKHLKGGERSSGSPTPSSTRSPPTSSTRCSASVSCRRR